MFLFTIGHHHLIDELPSIIRINSQDRKREQAPCALDRCQNCLLALIEERKTFGPPRCHICEDQGPEKTSRKACPSVRATMGHQICFHKAGLGLIPLLEGANGNLLLEQRPCLGSGEAMQTLCS